METEYRIEYADEALDDLYKLPLKTQRQVVKAIDKLGKPPRLGNVKQLKGYEKLFRLRTGDYRVVYTLENNVLVVTVVAVGPKKIFTSCLNGGLNKALPIVFSRLPN